MATHEVMRFIVVSHQIKEAGGDVRGATAVYQDEGADEGRNGTPIVTVRPHRTSRDGCLIRQASIK